MYIYIYIYTYVYIKLSISFYIKYISTYLFSRYMDHPISMCVYKAICEAPGECVDWAHWTTATANPILTWGADWEVNGVVSKQVGMSQNTLLITTVCSAFSGLINLHMPLKVWSGWNISCRNDLKQGMAQFWIQAPFG